MSVSIKGLGQRPMGILFPSTILSAARPASCQGIVHAVSATGGLALTPDVKSAQHAARPLLAQQHTVTKNTGLGSETWILEGWALPLTFPWPGWDAYHGVMYMPGIDHMLSEVNGMGIETHAQPTKLTMTEAAEPSAGHDVGHTSPST